MRGYQYYPRRRSGAKWILVLVIVGVLLFYANSKGIINLNLPNFGNLSFSNQSGLVEGCMQKVNACGEIINSKYGSTVNLLKQTQIANADDANAFLKTWKGASQSEDISAYNVSSYPITLIATRFDSGSKNPLMYLYASLTEVLKRQALQGSADFSNEILKSGSGIFYFSSGFRTSCILFVHAFQFN